LRYDLFVQSLVWKIRIEESLCDISSPLRLWVIFSLSPKLLLSVLQESGAAPF